MFNPMPPTNSPVSFLFKKQVDAWPNLSFESQIHRFSKGSPSHLKSVDSRRVQTPPMCHFLYIYISNKGLWEV